jgi:hypothetical protein
MKLRQISSNTSKWSFMCSKSLSMDNVEYRHPSINSYEGSSSPRWSSRTTTMWEPCSQYLVNIVLNDDQVGHFTCQIFSWYSKKSDSISAYEEIRAWLVRLAHPWSCVFYYVALRYWIMLLKLWFPYVLFYVFLSEHHFSLKLVLNYRFWQHQLTTIVGSW